MSRPKSDTTTERPRAEVALLDRDELSRFVRRTTEQSGVPEVIVDPVVIGAIARTLTS